MKTLSQPARSKRESLMEMPSGIHPSSSPIRAKIETGSHIMKKIKMIATALLAGFILQQPVMSQTSAAGGQPFTAPPGASGAASDTLISNVLLVSAAPVNTAAPVATPAAAAPAVASGNAPAIRPSPLLMPGRTHRPPGPTLNCRRLHFRMFPSPRPLSSWRGRRALII